MGLASSNTFIKNCYERISQGSESSGSPFFFLIHFHFKFDIFVVFLFDFFLMLF